VLVTDASDNAVSAVLIQRLNEELAPVSFYSKLVGPVERRYSMDEKECPAILFCCES
jgi:hypothetical protein